MAKLLAKGKGGSFWMTDAIHFFRYFCSEKSSPGDPGGFVK